jgi:hypothetical protein
MSAEALQHVTSDTRVPAFSDEDPDQLVPQREHRIDAADLVNEGPSNQTMYAYGYRCARDRLQVGICNRDVTPRVMGQIRTSTPDKPALGLVNRTHDGRALEIAMHGLFPLKGRNIVGGGNDDWILTTDLELLTIVRGIDGLQSPSKDTI